MNTTTATIRTMIVDDEVLARQNVEALLQSDPDIVIVAQSNNGAHALEAIKQHQPDLLFLDVQMTGMTGFEVLAKLPATMIPQVVFVTAYDHFALQAFEVQAVDYLLKPFNRARFAEALARAKGAVRSQDKRDFSKRLDEVMSALQKLQAAASKFADARAANETDLSGTARAALSIAARTADMVASVPEFTNRMSSMTGKALRIDRARLISSGTGAPSTVPSRAAFPSACVRTGFA